jgi:CRISPR-associated protein Csx10
MNCIELTIKAQAPLAIGRQKPGGLVSESENYIPGSNIRGAIAGHILRAANQRNADLSSNGGDFQSLFLDPDIAIFQNAYPAIARISKSELACVHDPIRVLPATALSSKENGGFKMHEQPEPEQAGGVFDTLLDRYCAEQCEQVYDPSCPRDRGRVEPYGGFYSRTDQSLKKGEYRYRRHGATTRFLTRVGINRRRATAQDEMLYGIEVLNESFLRDTKDKYPKWEYHTYRGYIWLQDTKLAHTLQTYINHHAQTFRIGGSVSRGLGRVILEANLQSPASNVQTRVQNFNTKLRERWQLWSTLLSGDRALPDRTFFAIDLQSEAILAENWQRTMVIVPSMLSDINGMQNVDLHLHASHASYDYRNGWNAAWGLMKETELITNCGSAFLFSINTPDAWKNKNWVAVLEDLETRGIGDRTAEGFGQVRICDEFHTIVRENAV